MENEHLKKNFPISPDGYVMPNSQDPINPRTGPVCSLIDDLIRYLEIRQGRQRSVEEQGGFGPKEEDNNEEEDGVREYGQEVASGLLEEKPHCSGADHGDNSRIPPPPQKHIRDWEK